MEEQPQLTHTFPPGLQDQVENLLTTPRHLGNYSDGAGSYTISLAPFSDGWSIAADCVNFNHLVSGYFGFTRGPISLRFVSLAPPLTKAIYRIFEVPPGIATEDALDRMAHVDWDIAQSAIQEMNVNPARIDHWFYNDTESTSTDYTTFGTIRVRRIMDPVGPIPSQRSFTVFIYYGLDCKVPGVFTPNNPYFS